MDIKESPAWVKELPDLHVFLNNQYNMDEMYSLKIGYISIQSSISEGVSGEISHITRSITPTRRAPVPCAMATIELEQLLNDIANNCKCYP